MHSVSKCKELFSFAAKMYTAVLCHNDFYTFAVTYNFTVWWMNVSLFKDFMKTIFNADFLIINFIVHILIYLMLTREKYVYIL